MLERCLLPAALLLGCAPATLPIVTSANVPSAQAHAVTNSAPPAPAHRPRHIARLAPPFAAAGSIRHVADGDAPTAIAAAP